LDAVPRQILMMGIELVIATFAVFNQLTELTDIYYFVSNINIHTLFFPHVSLHVDHPKIFHLKR
jgi:hypothetical protein